MGVRSDPVSSDHGQGAVSFSEETKNAARRCYENACAFCGKRTHLSVAHIVVKPEDYHWTPLHKRRCGREFHYDDVRNSILLCKNDKGACHDLFDSKELTLVPDRRRESLWTLLCSSESWHMLLNTEQNGKVWKCRPHHSFHQMCHNTMPYRRLLALRYREFLHKAAVTSEDALTHWETVCELSAADSEAVSQYGPPTKRARHGDPSTALDQLDV